MIKYQRFGRALLQQQVPRRKIQRRRREKQHEQGTADDGVEPDKTEDDIQREQLGPRGVLGEPSPAKMTPQRQKTTPEKVDPGHTA